MATQQRTFSDFALNSPLPSPRVRLTTPKTLSETVVERQLLSPSQKQLLQRRMRRQAHWLERLRWQIVLMALCFVLFQACRTAVLELGKLFVLLQNHGKIQQYYQQTSAESDRLHDLIRVYTSRAGIEDLARNRLGMVGQHEVLVRIYRNR